MVQGFSYSRVLAQRPMGYCSASIAYINVRWRSFVRYLGQAEVSLITCLISATRNDNVAPNHQITSNN